MRYRLVLPALLLAGALQAATIPTASEFLKLPIGDDRVLADYRQVVTYLRMLDQASPRLVIEDIGQTTLGETMVMAIISSEANMTNREHYREIAQKLADPRGLEQAETAKLVVEGKTIVLVTCNIHSTEIASTQMAMEWVHDLVTATDPETKKRLDNTILLLIPSLNPDGQIMETEWYRKYLGTRYEGGDMPWLYHHYTGHDNNRDFYMLTQKETRNLTRVAYHDWHPQIFVDIHQMGSTGPRMFIPPFADPVDPDVNPLIWREINLIGANMALRLEERNKAGLIYGYAFDAYWIGGTRNTGWWKNITGMLLEVASANLASPLFIDPTELQGGRKGLIEYKAQVNHPNPWKGGWWRMRDIMDYERIAADALHEIASERRNDFLRGVLSRARRAIESASPGEGYRIPLNQRDPSRARNLAQLLADHGVDVIETSAGDFFVPLDQPYAAFVREMLEPQRYPEVKPLAGETILEPYDVATWSLPLAMGVDATRVTESPAPVGKTLEASLPLVVSPPRFELTSIDGYVARPTGLEDYRAINHALRQGAHAWIVNDSKAGSIVYLDRAVRSSGAPAVPSYDSPVIASLPPMATPLKLPRVATYKPWNTSMDEGWTRWILDQYGFAPGTLDNKTIRSAATGGSRSPLLEKYDVIILPDIEKDVIATGNSKPEGNGMRYVRDLPPEFQGGLEKEGTKALRRFVEDGGTLIAFASACDWIISEFNVPVRNVIADVKKTDFNIPGSLLRVDVNRGHPITAGSPDKLAVFLAQPIAFATTLSGTEINHRVLASYPEDPRDILLSGWSRGEQKLVRRAAAVAMTWGKGKIVLFGFRVQNRGQMQGTLPMFFQSMYWAKADR